MRGSGGAGIAAGVGRAAARGARSLAAFGPDGAVDAGNVIADEPVERGLQPAAVGNEMVVRGIRGAHGLHAALGGGGAHTAADEARHGGERRADSPYEGDARSAACAQGGIEIIEPAVGGAVIIADVRTAARGVAEELDVPGLDLIGRVAVGVHHYAVSRLEYAQYNAGIVFAEAVALIPVECVDIVVVIHAIGLIRREHDDVHAVFFLDIIELFKKLCLLVGVDEIRFVGNSRGVGILLALILAAV